MAKVLDKINNLVFVRLTIEEFTKLDKTGLFDDDEATFDEAATSQEVKSKLTILATKL